MPYDVSLGASHSPFQTMASLVASLKVTSMLLLFPFAAPGISASPAEDNLRHFNVMILGPTQSPYEGRFCVAHNPRTSKEAVRAA